MTDQSILTANSFELTSDLLSKYWLCAETNFWTCSEKDHENIEETKIKEKCMISSKRVPKVKLMNFDISMEKLIEVIDMFQNPKWVLFAGNRKGSKRINASLKRTSFIGVSKNGPNWQSLITINSKKTYIGTYMTEIEAAKAYDFYWMLIHNLNAKTNFAYTKEEVHQLISTFNHLIL